MADGPAQAVAAQRTNPMKLIRSDLINIVIHQLLQETEGEVPKQFALNESR
jgi:hypothetical protein